MDIKTGRLGDSETLGITLVILAGSGIRHLRFANNYRAFFGKDNPELLVFDEFQATYTKNDNILFVVQPEDLEIFQPRIATAIEKITEQAWQIPYAIRVDSIRNFQHSWADEDDLTVQDLIVNGAQLTEEQLKEKEVIALAEPLLRNNLISADADTTGINVTLQYPEESLLEVPQAVGVARKIVADLKAEYPELTIALSGVHYKHGCERMHLSICVQSLQALRSCFRTSHNEILKAC